MLMLLINDLALERVGITSTATLTTIYSISVVIQHNSMYNTILIRSFMTAKIFTGEQKAKLVQLVNEGMVVLHEIDTLREGLSDTVKAIAEELEVKPSILKKAISIAHKASLGQTNADHEELNTILETVGKTL
jgi:transposase-like protein